MASGEFHTREGPPPDGPEAATSPLVQVPARQETGPPGGIVLRGAGGALRSSRGVKPRSAARGGMAPWARMPNGNESPPGPKRRAGTPGPKRRAGTRVKPRSAARGGMAPWARAPSGN